MRRSDTRGGSRAFLIEAFLAHFIDRQPEPPRVVASGRVLREVLRSTVGLAGFGFGTVMIVGSLGFLLTPKPTLGWQLLGSVFALAGLLFAAIPAMYARRIVRALKSGLVTTATIVSLESRTGPSRKTLASMRSGFAVGVRRVHYSGGDFEERFQYDGRGADRLNIGFAMRVLVAPDKPKVLLDVPVRPGTFF